MNTFRSLLWGCILLFSSLAHASNPVVTPPNPDLSRWEKESSYFCHIGDGVIYQEHTYAQRRRDGTKRILIRFLINNELYALEDLLIATYPSRVTYLRDHGEWVATARARLLFEEDFITTRSKALQEAGSSLDALNNAPCGNN